VSFADYASSPKPTSPEISNVTPRQRDLLALCFMEIDAELTAIEEGGVADGDPAEVEGALLHEQDELEFTLGGDWFEQRDAGE
jgi:hypothetical protein